MESLRKIQEGDYVILELSDGSGYIGLEDPQDKKEQDIAENYEDSRYAAKFFQMSNTRNLMMKAMFVLDNPQLKGSDIRYGSNIRIIQVSSNQALTSTEDIAFNFDSNRIILTDANDQNISGQQWNIYPKFNFRTEGEQVYEGDEVVFKSSNECLGNINVENHEVVIKKERESFKIQVLKKLDFDKQKESYIEAQMLIQLYNKDVNGYLSCSTKNKLAPSAQTIEELIGNILTDQNGYIQPMITKANDEDANNIYSTYFVIQLEENRSFDLIENGTVFRLVSQFCGKFISVAKNEVTNDYEICLEEEETKMNLFRFRKMTSEKTEQYGRSITNESIVFIQHVESKAFLALDMQNQGHDENFIPLTLKECINQLHYFQIKRVIGQEQTAQY